MKTLQECKDEVARYRGYKDFSDLEHELLSEIYACHDEAAKLYAQEACKEQREICADAAQLTTGSWGKEINRVAIKNAPEPTLL